LLISTKMISKIYTFEIPNIEIFGRSEARSVSEILEILRNPQSFKFPANVGGGNLKCAVK